MKVGIICVADRPERLPLLVWSLIAQTHEEWELLVLDQSEADIDQPGVMRYMPLLPGRVSDRIKVRRVARAGDWGYMAKEVAALESKCDVLLFPQDDSYYVPTALFEFTSALNYSNAQLAICGWLYDLERYAAIPPIPAIGRVDVGGFMVRREAFVSAGGWPKPIAQQTDGMFIERMARDVKTVSIPSVLYVRN